MFLVKAMEDVTTKLLDRPRRVWLGNATVDSVLEALTSNLFEGCSDFGPVSAVYNNAECRPNIIRVFDAYGSLNPVDKKRYWNERDLGRFLQTRLPLAALSASISILWRCFHFHAYFPFAQQSPDQIDCDAFQRAVVLLGADGISRLGYSSLGIEIDPDRDRTFNSLYRIFRSLAIPSLSTPSSENPSGNQAEQWSQTDDLLDVLDLVQPSRVPYGPTCRDELLIHASRILGSSKFYTYSSIPRGDIMSLLTLLLSIQIDEPEGGASFNTAHPSEGLDEEMPERLANAILRRFASDEECDIDWYAFSSILSNYLVHLPSQMSFIFTSFLSPVPSKASSANRPDTILSLPCVQYLSLLNPPYSQNYHLKVQRALQRPNLKVAYSAPATTLFASSFASAVAPIKTSTLLLLTGDLNSTTASFPSNPSNPVKQPATAHPTTCITFAVSMPFPWGSDGKDNTRPHIGASHGLFQLEPTLQVLRPIRPWSLSADMLSLDNAAEKGVLRFGKKGESGLSIDFNQGLATLRRLSSKAEDASMLGAIRSEEVDGYRDIGLVAKEDGWETSMRIRSLELYVMEVESPPLAEEVDQKKQDELRTIEAHRLAELDRVAQEAGPKVSEEELRKRIQGIGRSQESQAHDKEMRRLATPQEARDKVSKKELGKRIQGFGSSG